MPRLAIIVTLAALAASGCGWLGRFDAVTVEVDPRDNALTGTTDIVVPDGGEGGTADAGDAGDGGGDDSGTADDGGGSAGDTDAADGDDSGGGDDSTLPVDTDAPEIDPLTDVVTKVQITKTAVVTDDSAFNLQWAMTAGPGILTFGTATAAATTISASMDGVYTVEITATDAGALVATESFQLTWDTDAPDNLTAFSGTDGVSAATVDLTWTIPAGAADYETLTVRRLAGAMAPADCTAGALAATFSAPFAAGAVTYTDDTDVGDQNFSYRICIVDAAGNETSDASETATNFVAKGHLMFVTSGVTNGALGGGGGDARDRADAICQAHGTGSSLGAVNEEARWRAVLSVDTQDAIDRLSIFGPIDSTDGVTNISPNAAGFWSSLLQNSVYNDQEGLVGPATAWTGTAGNGTATANNCSNWTATTNAFQGTAGDANATDATWVAIAAPVDCDDATSGLYCVSQYDTQPLDDFAAVTGSVAGGTVDLTIDMPASMLGYEELKIRSAVGGTAPATCTAGTAVTTIADPAHGVLTYRHQGLTAGGTYSYRLCVLDAAGTVVDEATVLGVTSSL